MQEKVIKVGANHAFLTRDSDVGQMRPEITSQQSEELLNYETKN